MSSKTKTTIEICICAAFIGLIGVTAIGLTGCEDSARIDQPVVLPEGLKDCTFYLIRQDGVRIRVVRCPNSATSTTVPGKTAQYTTTIEDEQAKAKVELERKKAQALAKLSDQDKKALGLN